MSQQCFFIYFFLVGAVIYEMSSIKNANIKYIKKVERQQTKILDNNVMYLSRRS